MRNSRALLSVVVLWCTLAARAEVQIERTFLPDAHASSFAFGLPGGVNFCYDPVRGGVNYAWTGGFIDLTNVRPVNKLVKAATLLGPIVYREAGPAPLRHGDALRAPVIEFKGYTLRAAAVELRYTIDGIFVHEEISANQDKSGLIRKFTVKKSAGEKWWYVLDGLPPALLTAESAGEFSIVDQFKKATP